MAKDLDFKDYTAQVKDRDGDNHESTVRAAIVDNDTAFIVIEDAAGAKQKVPREVVTPTGSRRVQPGDVLVETDRAGVYDYVTGEGWADTGYDTTGDTADSSDGVDAVTGDDADKDSSPDRQQTTSQQKQQSQKTQQDTSQKRALPGASGKR